MNESSIKRILRSNTARTQHTLEVSVKSTQISKKRCSKKSQDVRKTGSDSEGDEFEILLDDEYEIVRDDNNKIVQNDHKTEEYDSDPQKATELQSEPLQNSAHRTKKKCNVYLERIKRLEETCASQRLKIKRLQGKINRQNNKVSMFVQIIQDLQKRRNKYRLEKTS